MSQSNMHRSAGVLAPLFSIYSGKSIGVGDFSDLKLLIDWAKSSGNSIIQLLPMNEVGLLFCPYDSISSFAIEPAYVTISPKKKENLKKTFPAGKPYVDYSVKKEKVKIDQANQAEQITDKILDLLIGPGDLLGQDRRHHFVAPLRPGAAFHASAIQPCHALSTISKRRPHRPPTSAGFQSSSWPDRHWRCSRRCGFLPGWPVVP